MPQLMSDLQVLSSSPFHSISRVTVYLDAIPANGDVYLPDSYKKDAFALSKPGFMKLLGAAGMQILPESVEASMPEDRIYAHKLAIKWTQPDGKEQILPGHKTFDLRIGGTRWDKARETALDFSLMNWGRENKVYREKDKNDRYEHNAEYIPRVIMAMKEQGQDSVLERLELFARERATRQVRQQAQFGSELAETGAIERAVKAQLGLKSTYSKAELTEGFEILRSEFRWDLIAGQIGEENAKQLKKAFIAKQLGFDMEELVLLNAGGSVTRAAKTDLESATDEFFGDGDESVEGAVVYPGDPEDEKLFTQPISDETSMRLRNKMIKFHGWLDGWRMTEASKRIDWLFGFQFGDLTEGHALLAITFYDKMKAAVDRKDGKVEQREQAKLLKEQLLKCVVKQRLWADPTEEGNQLELPGIDNQEIEDGNSNNHIVADDESDKE